MMDRLRAREYSLVVYGSFKRSRDFFSDIVLPLYGNEASKIWLVDGEDGFNGWAWRVMEGKVRKNSTVFIREMPQWITI